MESFGDVEFFVNISLGLTALIFVVAALLGYEIRFPPSRNGFKLWNRESEDNPNHPLNPHYNSGIDEDGKFRE